MWLTSPMRYNNEWKYTNLMPDQRVLFVSRWGHYCCPHHAVICMTSPCDNRSGLTCTPTVLIVFSFLVPLKGGVFSTIPNLFSPCASRRAEAGPSFNGVSPCFTFSFFFFFLFYVLLSSRLRRLSPGRGGSVTHPSSSRHFLLLTLALSLLLSPPPSLPDTSPSITRP
jgi:hypothetical protein